MDLSSANSAWMDLAPLPDEVPFPGASYIPAASTTLAPTTTEVETRSARGTASEDTKRTHFPCPLLFFNLDLHPVVPAGHTFSQRGSLGNTHVTALHGGGCGLG